MIFHNTISLNCPMTHQVTLVLSTMIILPFCSFKFIMCRNHQGSVLQTSILRLQLLIYFASEGVNQSPTFCTSEGPSSPHPGFIKKLKQSRAEEKKIMVPKTDGYISTTTTSLTDMPFYKHFHFNREGETSISLCLSQTSPSWIRLAHYHHLVATAAFTCSHYR